jgi:hypothetical protein
MFLLTCWGEGSSPSDVAYVLKEKLKRGFNAQPQRHFGGLIILAREAVLVGDTSCSPWCDVAHHIPQVGAASTPDKR